MVTDTKKENIRIIKQKIIKKIQKHIILKTENLSIGYQQKQQQKVIAKNINLSIKKGTFIALLGKNGIGKSTLLRTLANVQNPLNGTIFIDHKKLVDYTNATLATQLSLVLTEKLPESQLTVFELIALGRQPYTNWIDSLTQEDFKKIDWAMQQTEVYHLKNHRFYELSDGQLQRVLIARALAQDTSLIILDEPTAHLDIHHTIKIFSLLKKLVQKTGKTILVSTHEVNLAIQLADSLLLLTEEMLYAGNTMQLIKQNAFEKLFPLDLIKFNRTLQQFIINQKD